MTNELTNTKLRIIFDEIHNIDKKIGEKESHLKYWKVYINGEMPLEYRQEKEQEIAELKIKKQNCFSLAEETLKEFK